MKRARSALCCRSERSCHGPLRLAAFLGGKDANFTMGLFRPGDAWPPDDDRGAARRRRAGSRQPRVDAFLLVNQPRDWRGTANPLAGAPRQPSPSFAYKSVLPARFRRLARRARLQGGAKETAQEGQAPRGDGPPRPSPRRRRGRSRTHPRRVRRAETRAHARAGDRRPLRKRAKRARSCGASRRSGLAEGAPRLELHALFVGDRIVATFGALSAGDRLSGLFISYDCDPEIARSSPGELMVQAVVREAIARGIRTFDLGVGEARYKDEACESEEELFDSAFAITPLGRAAALAFKLKQRAKRRIKRSPRLFSLFRRLRAALG